MAAPPTDLIRLTAASGRRRVDLAVPAAIPVADLLPDLARATGLLDPAAAYAGYRIVDAAGQSLRGDHGLTEQGVRDGALLTVAARAEEPAPLVHDDQAEALADATAGIRRWRRDHARRTATVVAAILLVAGLAAPVTAGVDRVVAMLDGLPVREPTAILAVLLVVVVLGGSAMPVVAIGVGRDDPVPLDLAAVAARARRGHRTLVGSAAGVGLVSAALAPAAAARGTAGVLLGVAASGVLLLRARQHRAFAAVLVDVVAGLAVLAAVAVTLAARDPTIRPALAAASVGGAVSLAVLARMPMPSEARRGRVGDLVETFVLVALPLLLVTATGGLSWLADIGD